LRPVIGRPAHLLVPWIDGEVEDIVLRDTQVFEDLPRGVQRTAGPAAPQDGCEVLDGTVEIRVRLAPIERLREQRPNAV
jgi:hypothetical protein